MPRYSVFAPGDRIQIGYRLSAFLEAGEEDTTETWIGAEAIQCEPGAWPLVRLSDGRSTKVRPFMPWRHAPGYGPYAHCLAAWFPTP